MLNDLQSLQNGTLSPTFFMRSMVSQRVANMELSKTGSICKYHQSTINCLDIDSIEDRYLLSGNNNGQICIHELSLIPSAFSYTCKLINSRHADERRYSHNYSVDTVQWYPFDTGSFTTSGMDHQLKIWDTTNFKPVDTILLPNGIYNHHVSTIATNHSLVAVAMQQPQAILVDMRTGAQCHQLQGHTSRIMSVKWSPFAEYLLATGGADNRLLLWDIRSAKGFLKALDQYNGEALSGKKDLVSAHNGMINSLCFSSDGLFLVSFGTDYRLRLWDVTLGKNMLVNYGRIPNESRKRVQMDICYDASIPMIFVPSQSRVLMYEMFTGRKYNTLIGHLGVTTCCVFRNQYHELYSGGHDCETLVWGSNDGYNVLRQEKQLAQSSLHDAWSDEEN